MRYLSIFGVAFSLILGFFALQVSKKEFESELEKQLGVEILEILSDPVSIKIAPAFSTGFASGGTGIEYLLQSSAQKLNALQGFKIQKLILSEENYTYNKTKKGLFIPTNVLYFEKNNQIVVILISSLLNQIKIIKDEKTIILDYDPMQEKFNNQISTLGDL